VLTAPNRVDDLGVGDLTADDFYTTTHAELFTLIATQIRAGRPHDPASIASAITIAGGGRHAQLALRALTEATIAGAGPESAGTRPPSSLPPPTGVATSPPPPPPPKPPPSYPRRTCSPTY